MSGDGSTARSAGDPMVVGSSRFQLRTGGQEAGRTYGEVGGEGVRREHTDLAVVSRRVAAE